MLKSRTPMWLQCLPFFAFIQDLLLVIYQSKRVGRKYFSRDFKKLLEKILIVV